MDIWAFLLILGAAGRCSWLLTDDKLAAPLREWEKLPAWVRDWLGCPWCTGPWLAAAWLAWWALAPDAACFVYPAAVLSASLLYGWAYGLYHRAVRPAQPAVVVRPDTRQTRLTDRT